MTSPAAASRPRAADDRLARTAPGRPGEGRDAAPWTPGAGHFIAASILDSRMMIHLLARRGTDDTLHLAPPPPRPCPRADRRASRPRGGRRGGAGPRPGRISLRP